MSGYLNPYLKPCPFCGGEAEIIDAIESGEDVPYVTCKNPDCGAQTECFYRRKFAADAWNYGPRKFDKPTESQPTPNETEAPIS